MGGEVGGAAAQLQDNVDIIYRDGSSGFEWFHLPLTL